ncbi:MAG: twin-arginine translocation signal domain-containing protein [Halomonas sp.]
MANSTVNPSRRRFLKGAAAAGAAGSPPHCEDGPAISSHSPKVPTMPRRPEEPAGIP